ncbi:MAG: hypothetical protein H6831_11555 [Planctomycetes bacterium]|nr:hypothetical protein [Planctomycetota bacterium]MCB9905035.1 hypothetical protein [Planctomycetota bacterium]
MQRFHDLKELESAMSQLLTKIQDESSDPADFTRLRERCSTLQAVFQDIAADRQNMTETEREQVHAALENLVKLNAIAREAVEAEKQRVSSLLDRVRNAGRRTQLFAGLDDAGGSCNVAG